MVGEIVIRRPLWNRRQAQHEQAEAGGNAEHEGDSVFSRKQTTSGITDSRLFVGVRGVLRLLLQYQN
jgi:hypothetical protein